MQLEFQIHPLKDEIVRRWETGHTSKSIHAWLQADHPEVVLSLATLCKHHRRFKANQKRMQSLDAKADDEQRKKKRQVPLEEILWETIAQCRRMKKDKTISVKDYQYLDQQLQSAVEKLIRIQDASGEQRDISHVLSEIFGKIESEEEFELVLPAKKPLTEEEKLRIAEEVDNENQGIPEETAEVL